jgi:hypothetical protein
MPIRRTGIVTSYFHLRNGAQDSQHFRQLRRSASEGYINYNT